jgi:chaperonin GroES
MNKQIKPENGNIVLKPIEEGETTFGNIILPDLGKDRPEMGKVIAVSTIYNYHTDKHIECSNKVDDVVLIPKMGAQRVVIEGEEFYICKSTDVFATLI